ncbi:MAG: hypothetical protein U1F08_03765 [Steroidobacteraceae bacterium]
MRGTFIVVQALAASLWAAASPAARAEVQQSSPSGALIQHHYTIAASPAATWETLVHPERWWPADHTWSGNPSNLRLEARAGGCYCESWGESSAEHGRIVMARPGELLRIVGALGPLQELAVSAVLTIRLAPAAGGGTEATVVYRISGDASHGLDAFAPAVDRVLGQQFGNFARAAAAPPVTPSP